MNGNGLNAGLEGVLHSWDYNYLDREYFRDVDITNVWVIST